ncbi:uncharacterized protein N7477_009341 [Penicillium maclennaniae]|uniref:uncharacterized protein n=1 Tax=Penicillium maclennaniae TaxID=1343394 RepID=UPI0025416156|nr:uncharacterized protein N7477_009341 [Penicillium maclennaniae]KAJ5661725.1 hypothetical protein N7477_009341 [Penicillium maclennaniae]
MFESSLTNSTILAEIETEGSLNAMVNLYMLKRLRIPWAFLIGFARDPTKRLQDVIPKIANHDERVEDTEL